MQISICALQPTVNRYDALVDWISDDISPKSAVLEVGAGRGQLGYAERIRESVYCLVGVDPDPGVNDNPHLHKCYQMTLETFAQCEMCKFDVIYSHMVLEHIGEPLDFLSAVFGLLKPGGVFFSVTPNLAHYFGIISYLAERLSLQDWLLRKLRGEADTASYHFEATYQMNTVWSLRGLFQQMGAMRLDFRMIESPSSFACYFPKSIRFIPNLHSFLVYFLKLYPCMGTILFRAQKPF